MYGQNAMIQGFGHDPIVKGAAPMLPQSPPPRSIGIAASEVREQALMLRDDVCKLAGMLGPFLLPSSPDAATAGSAAPAVAQSEVREGLDGTSQILRDIRSHVASIAARVDL